MIKPKEYFEDNDLPVAGYYSQFETVKTLEVGKTYRQKGSIYWADYKILFIVDGVALGVEVANGNNNCSLGGKTLFTTDGLFTGWKYRDCRSCYRLVSEKATPPSPIKKISDLVDNMYDINKIFNRYTATTVSFKVGGKRHTKKIFNGGNKRGSAYINFNKEKYSISELYKLA